jgi:Leucine-rich repeat (LRR) protein
MSNDEAIHAKHSDMPSEKKPSRRRWRFQFSLRSLLIFVSVVGVLCGYLGIFIQNVQKQRKAVKSIQRLGGQVHYDYEYDWSAFEATPPGPAFLRKMFGDDIFANVVDVSLYSETTAIQDKDVVILRELPRIKILSLNGPDITDESLKIVAELELLESLGLYRTKITGEGLKLLERNANLRHIVFDGPTVNDTTLANIEKLQNLRSIILRGTAITDAGLSKLPQLVSLRELTIGPHPALTANCLATISKIENLESLTLMGNISTSNNFAELRSLKKLKQLGIDSAAFDDHCMESVIHLDKLKSLNLAGTAITDSGMEKLKPLKILVSLDVSGTKVTQKGVLQLEYVSHLTIGPGLQKPALLELQKQFPKCTIGYVTPTGCIEWSPPYEATNFGK